MSAQDPDVAVTARGAWVVADHFYRRQGAAGDGKIRFRLHMPPAAGRSRAP